MDEGLAQRVLQYFKSRLDPCGLEFHPFLVGWYNELLEADKKLNYPDDTLACVILSIPGMFEKLFIPFIKALSDAEFDALCDPLDSAIGHKLEEVRRECTLVDNDAIDLEPKITLQTAVDVSRACRLYDSSDLDEDELFETPFGKVCCCAIHPRYGGWFFIRAIYVFKNVQHPDLERPPRLEILGSKAEIRDFLYKANCHGLEYLGGWRDFGKPVERYSYQQIEYYKMSHSENEEEKKKAREMLASFRA